MNNQQKLEHIQSQLDELFEARKAVNKEIERDLLSNLDWTQKINAELISEDICAMGLPKHRIILFGESPKVAESITVMGSSPRYEENMLYGAVYSIKEYHNKFCFYTSSDDMLFKFLEKVRFKSFEYGSKRLQFLERIRNILESYNDRS